MPRSKAKKESVKNESKLPENVDFGTMDIQSLQQLSQTLKKENTITLTRLGQGKIALDKNMEASRALNKIQFKNNLEVLVPVTESMYVPGVLMTTDSALVDIGTEIIVEKTIPETHQFLARQKNLLEDVNNTLRKQFEQGRLVFSQVQQTLQMKVKAMQMSQERQKKESSEL